MFEAPVTFIESKKQKTSFEDVDGNKVIGYLEKDSPGTSNNINFPDFNTFSYRDVIRYRWSGKILILGTRDQSMSSSLMRLQNSPYYCVGQESARGRRKGLEGEETGERREKYSFFSSFSAFVFSFASHAIGLCEARVSRENLTRVKTDGETGLPQLVLRLLLFSLVSTN